MMCGDQFRGSSKGLCRRRRRLLLLLRRLSNNDVLVKLLLLVMLLRHSDCCRKERFLPIVEAESVPDDRTWLLPVLLIMWKRGCYSNVSRYVEEPR